MTQKTIQNIKSIIFALAIVIGTTYVSAAWTPAPANPPANNVPAPINVGGKDGIDTTKWYTQTKTGNLILTGLSTIDRLITGDLTVASTTPITVGQVLTAVDTTGKVGWACSNPTYTVISTIVPGTTQWAAPTGVTSVKVEAWGAGGGGGGGMVDNAGAGGGGGSGGYSSSVLTVVPGTIYQVTVGQGGAGGAVGSDWHYPGSPGTAATTDTTFVLNGTTRIIAKGGGGGPGGSASTGGIGAVAGTGSTALSGNNAPPGTDYYQISSPGATAPNSLASNAGKGGSGGISYGNTGNTAGSSGNPGAIVISVPGGCGGGTTAAAGVSSITAGTGISVSGSTGAVTVSATGGGDSLISSVAAYKSSSAASVTVVIPTGADYAVLTMKGNTTYAGSGRPSEEDHETMEAIFDFSTQKSTGTHSVSVGADDVFTLQYGWNAQSFGSSISTTIGDVSGPTAYGAVIGPNFTVSGSNLVMSNLSGDQSSRPWQQSFLIKFYNRN